MSKEELVDKLQAREKLGTRLEVTAWNKKNAKEKLKKELRKMGIKGKVKISYTYRIGNRYSLYYDVIPTKHAKR